MNDVLRDERARGWFHLDNAVIDEYLPKIGVTAFAVYACIVRHADPRGNAFPSYTLLQKELGTGRTQIADAVKKLVDAGLVTITTGRRLSNLYHVVTVSTSPAAGLVPNQDQSRRETSTSPAKRPVLVPQRDSNNTQLTRPKEQDPRERERASANGANGHGAPAPPRRMGNLVRLPDPFANDTPEMEAWVRQQKMPFAWVNNRTDSFVSHYRESGTLLTLDAWQERWKKWLLDDWAKQRDSGLIARR